MHVDSSKTISKISPSRHYADVMIEFFPQLSHHYETWVFKSHFCWYERSPYFTFNSNFLCL